MRNSIFSFGFAHVAEVRHIYIYMSKYVDQRNAMVVTKRSAGVKSGVNLRNPLYTGDEIHPAFATQGRDQKLSKIVVLVSPHKGLCPS